MKNFSFPTSKVKILASLWLITFVLLSALAFWNTEKIETHELTRVLHFGYDAFGRNCILLTFETAFRSTLVILPVAFFCLFAGAFLSFLGTLKVPTFTFAWKTLVDTLASLPGFLIALSLSLFLANATSAVLLAAVLLVLPHLIRFFESQLIHLKDQDFIKGSEALGGNSLHVFTHHLAPELFQSALTLFPFIITRLLVIETALSFLGLRFSTGHESWGHLLYQGKDYIVEAPWILILGSVPLFLTLFSFHLLSSHDQN